VEGELARLAVGSVAVKVGAKEAATGFA